MNKPFSVSDIESTQWKNFALAGSYDGTFYETHETIEDLICHHFSPSHFPDIVFFHYGGIFDFLFIFDWFFKQDFNLWEIKNIIIQGKKILKFDLVHTPEPPFKKRTIEYRDSSGLFPIGLGKLTQSFDVEHKKLDLNLEHVEFDKENPEHLLYLEHDCLGLYESIEKYMEQPYIRDVGLKLTQSGVAFSVYNEFFNERPDGTLKLAHLKSEVQIFARAGYYGGRTEIFKQSFDNGLDFDENGDLINIREDAPNFGEILNCYDINSMYPAAMRDNDYPGEFSHWSTELDLTQDLFIIDAVVTCPDNLDKPLLPLKDGKLLFPAGTFRGHFYSPEFKKALDLGYKIEKVYKVCYFENAGKIFSEFVNHFYELRRKSKCPVQKFIYKDILVRLYGRIGINTARENLSFKKTDTIHSEINLGEYSIRLYKEQKKINTYTNVAIAGFVTSYSRLNLYSYFSDHTYNCDTDSVFTTEIMKSSDVLGEMKFEQDYDQASFLLPKTYMMKKHKGAGLVRKMKGFPDKFISHIGYECFVESVNGMPKIPTVNIKKGLAGFKTAMKKGDLLTVLPDQPRTIRSKYDKRIIIDAQTTKPRRYEYDEKIGNIDKEKMRQLEFDF